MPVLARVEFPSVSVEFAASVLRMNPKTLYRNMEEIPHTRIGNYYRIPVSFLMFEYVQPYSVASHDPSYDPEQYEFEYDVPVRGVRRYRNGQVRQLGDYETSLSNKKWRNPSHI